MAKDNQKQIKSLLTQLEKSTDKKEKRKIRANLRALGHRGGLGKAKKS